MKSLTREEIISIANKHCLPTCPKVVWEFVEYGLMEFVAEILNAACTTPGQLENVGGAQ